jgi:hypothetical protein
MPTNGQFAAGEVLTASNTNTLLTRGYSNRIINGAFTINQRVYASGANLANGVYGLDRWRSGFTNTALTFTAGVQSTTVTISSGGVLQQVVERENMPAGTYTLSWTGTATGRVYNVGAFAPSYGSSPQIVTLDGSANVMVEFTASGGTRTLSLVQLEAGSVFSPFEYRQRQVELALCQRYYEKSYDLATALGTATLLGAASQWYGAFNGNHRTWAPFKVTKRVAPTFRGYSPTTGAIDRFDYQGFGDAIYAVFPGVGAWYGGVGVITCAGVNAQWTADAEF